MGDGVLGIASSAAGAFCGAEGNFLHAPIGWVEVHVVEEVDAGLVFERPFLRKVRPFERCKG